MSDLQQRIEALTRSHANLLALLRDVDELSDRVRNAEASAPQQAPAGPGGADCMNEKVN